MIVITGATGRTGRVAIRRLRWSQIDLEKRTLVVGHSKWEAGTGRAIPLNLTAWQALLRWAQAAILVPCRRHYVFPGCESKRIDPTRSGGGDQLGALL